MSAPTSAHAHDLAALADRLQRIQDDVAQVGAEIAAIAQAQADRHPVEGRAEGGAVLTPTEAAKLLGRSKSWVNDRIRDGVLPAVRIGTRWLLRRSDLVAGGWL